MSQGHVKWDDDDNFLHLSDKGGVLPDGVFGYDTKLYFCCRTDGNKTEPVSLPTDQPFFLLAYGSPQCQQVKWALATSEWIHFDVQDSLGINDQGGTYPYGAGINGHTIHYCHYQSKRYNEETVSLYLNSVHITRPIPVSTFTQLHLQSKLVACKAFRQQSGSQWSASGTIRNLAKDFRTYRGS